MLKDLSDIKVGDTFFTISQGIVTCTYAGEMVVAGGEYGYFRDGRRNSSDKYPSAWAEKPEFFNQYDVPKIEKDTLVEVWNDDDPIKYRRFATGKFSTTVLIDTYPNGACSASCDNSFGPTLWQHYEICEEQPITGRRV